MRRNCNLELQLFPASFSPDSGEHRRQAEAGMMTIFYGGSVCVKDVTESQARAIMTLAGREMESATPAGSPYSPPSRSVGSGGSMSMKRSLKQFLLKRRNRLQATTPYRR